MQLVTERVWKVSELIRQINVELFRYNDISVEGEATNVVRSAAGHIYFSIKDSRAQMRVVLFATNARFLRFRIENGLQLVVRGRVTLYEQKGEFQLNAVAVEPAGLGALQLAFEQLKKQLADEGLFDPARKKAIPMLPQRIAIVTSPTGAAIRDVLNVLGRRFEGLSVQIYPVRVQGRDASREIAIAIRHLSRWQLHDVVLICRGGGSLEDLWAFNEESVARAVAACSIPTISAIGHETDFTICDFVADLRAPTPSAAAEIVIRAKSEICTQIDHMARRVRHVVESRVRNYRHELRHLASSDRLGLLPRRIASRRERLDRSRVTLFRMLEARARSMRSRLAAVNAPLLRFPSQVARERERLRSTAATLGAVSPLSVLSRGYAIAFSRTKRGKRKPIMDVSAVAIGEPIEVQLKTGRLECTVDAKTMGLETVWPTTGE
ncbi:MAG: exodeoxyribonuclease VII large subunit [Acidobacteria bacterium]|nr:exodeoxyribonuclease VII large subunit [Acidobacteriota bacterium]MBV9068915.1 exodeoxyribonuclease VII large subunit [Acidobacteriota bacterium]MBV9184949.1 exodeoxyribonuclease VII large subunit [Acidobacteriota bacterium]